MFETLTTTAFSLLESMLLLLGTARSLTTVDELWGKSTRERVWISSLEYVIQHDPFKEAPIC